MIARIGVVTVVALLAACGGSHSQSPDASADGANSDAGTDANNGPLTVLGQPDVTHDLDIELGLTQPQQLAFAGGRLVVADQGNNRVLVWNGVPSAPGTPPDLVLGRPDANLGVISNLSSSLAGFPCSATSLSDPSGVWTDGTRLAVVDFVNNRVLVWNTFPTTSGQAADFALGQASGAGNLETDGPNIPGEQCHGRHDV